VSEYWNPREANPRAARTDWNVFFKARPGAIYKMFIFRLLRNEVW
jgi:hypothetical protein